MRGLRFYNRIGFRLIATYVLIVLIGALVSGYFAVRFAEDSFRDTVRAQFESTVDLTENFIDFAGQNAALWVRHLASNLELRQPFLAGDHGDLAQLTVEHAQVLSAEAVIVVDGEGSIVAGHVEGAAVEDLAPVILIEETLRKGVSLTRITEGLANFLIFASAPIIADPKPGETEGAVAGAVLVGYVLSDALVGAVKKNTDIDITVIRRRAVMASTLTHEGERIVDLPIPFIDYQLLLQLGDGLMEAQIFGEKYFIAAKSLTAMDQNVPGSILLSYPRQRLTETETDLTHKILVAFVIGFAVVTLIGVRLSRYLIREIDHLVERTSRITEGDLNTRVEVGSHDEFGVLGSHFNTMVDAVQRKNEELRTHSIELERKVEERTRALEKSNTELQQFAYVASHDLQEPLRMITSYTQLIEKRNAEKMDEESQEFLHFVTDGAKRMSQLIKALLEYSRVDSRTKPFLPLDMEAVVQTAVHHLQRTIDDNDARITVGDMPRVIGDEIQLISLVQNLIANAVKYRDASRPPEVHIQAEPAGEERSWRVSIRDNGIGIAPEFQDRIFTIFQRLHGHGEFEGTGIGLAVCKKIVERHGGEMTVDSTPGEGSTFAFTLPAADRSEAI